jgi:hypothetical protein
LKEALGRKRSQAGVRVREALVDDWSGTGVGDDRDKVEGPLNLVAVARTLGGGDFHRQSVRPFGRDLKVRGTEDEAAFAG